MDLSPSSEAASCAARQIQLLNKICFYALQQLFCMVEEHGF
jgi:hypothetical protein